jgi:G protein-coupled receptor kinase-interacting protein 1 C term
VASIQVLIEAIRGEEPMQNVRSNIVKIVSTVDNVVAAAEKGSEEPTSYQSEWRAQTTPVQDNLDEYKAQLLQASHDSMSYDNHSSAKEFTQKLPPLAFQVARETRELVRRVQGIKSGGGGDDDFS